MNTSKYGDAPALKHLSRESARSLIVRLRDSVAPILDNNTLPHFTDHSVSHSDEVANLVDGIINPIQQADTALSQKELIILYSACYLHDIGLQYENAGNTQVVSDLGLTMPWHELDANDRRNILRKFHHQISAEMVQSSVRAEDPIIGLQLTEDYEPSKVACLCEAHNLFLEVPADANIYRKLTEDGPGMRMALLAGLLRIADILEESRRRATREKARTLMLDTYAQTHWWRHYYTENVTLDENERTITLWFDFPPTKFDAYSRVIPELQKPWIDAEFARHAVVFNKFGVAWTLQVEMKATPHSVTEEMPDKVFAAMLAEIHRRNLKEDEERRAIILSTFRDSRPHVRARLDDLAERKDQIPPEEHLVELVALSQDLWDIGSRRSAVMTVVFEYGRSAQHLDEIQRVEIGTRILRMCLSEDLASLANSWGDSLHEIAMRLDKSQPIVIQCLQALAEWYIALCRIPDAKAVFATLTKFCSESELAVLAATMDEVSFLQGELVSLINIAETEPERDQCSKN